MAYKQFGQKHYELLTNPPKIIAKKYLNVSNLNKTQHY